MLLVIQRMGGYFKDEVEMTYYEYSLYIRVFCVHVQIVLFSTETFPPPPLPPRAIFFFVTNVEVQMFCLRLKLLPKAPGAFPLVAYISEYHTWFCSLPSCFTFLSVNIYGTWAKHISMYTTDKYMWEYIWSPGIIHVSVDSYVIKTNRGITRIYSCHWIKPEQAVVQLTD